MRMTKLLAKHRLLARMMYLVRSANMNWLDGRSFKCPRAAKFSITSERLEHEMGHLWRQCL